MNILPEQSLETHIAILGRTGSGKTYAAKGIVESMLAERHRVCILDPTGAWWGLRSSDDGKRPGFPVVVFGGDHADIPITEHAGGPLGELIAANNIPAVIDLSGTTLGERHRFVERFAEALFRANREPLHLIIDEADEFAPQSGPPGTERMLGAIDRIVRRGRIKGFRVMLISQRPAVLNKNVLTQASTLIAMRLPAPQDRKAVEDWIKGQGDTEKGKEVLASLARLQRGEGWVWAPDQGVLDRVQFPTITTYDSGRTPEVGEKRRIPSRLAEVDLSSVTAAMEAATAEARANDPAELRKQILHLEAELKRSKAQPEEADPRLIDAAVSAALTRRDEEWAAEVSRLHGAAMTLDDRLRQIQHLAVPLNGDLPRPSVGAPLPAARSSTPPYAPARNIAPRTPCAPAERPDLTGPQCRILDAIAELAALGVPRPSRQQVGFFASYVASSGSFRNALGSLRTAGLVVYPDDGAVCLTPAGEARASSVGVPRSCEELHARCRQLLSGPQRKILDVLIEARGRPVSRTQLAELSGYVASSGSFRNALGSLRTLGMAAYPKNTTAAASSMLFPESLP